MQVYLPLVKTLNVVSEGSLGCEGANLPVLDPTEHGAEAGVRGPGLGAGARLVLEEKKHIIILFICLFSRCFSHIIISPNMLLN